MILLSSSVNTPSIECTCNTSSKSERCRTCDQDKYLGSGRWSSWLVGWLVRSFVRSFVGRSVGRSVGWLRVGRCTPSVHRRTGTHRICADPRYFRCNPRQSDPGLGSREHDIGSDCEGSISVAFSSTGLWPRVAGACANLVPLSYHSNTQRYALVALVGAASALEVIDQPVCACVCVHACACWCVCACVRLCVGGRGRGVGYRVPPCKVQRRR